MSGPRLVVPRLVGATPEERGREALVILAAVSDLLAGRLPDNPRRQAFCRRLAENLSARANPPPPRSRLRLVRPPDAGAA